MGGWCKSVIDKCSWNCPIPKFVQEFRSVLIVCKLHEDVINKQKEKLYESKVISNNKSFRRCGHNINHNSDMICTKKSAHYNFLTLQNACTKGIIDIFV